MTENKRFGFEMDKNCYKCIVDIRDKKLYTDKKQVVGLLNELNDKCDFLEIENEALEDSATKYAELYHKSLKENEQLKLSSTMYYNLFKELQRQMQGVKSIYDLDSKDFEDLIELSKGNVFDDKIGWVHLPIKELQMND